jgi:DNA uptake protein ComE-like DNA-binding protein
VNVRDSSTSGAKREDGSVLIIVLWIAFGLVSLALYFAQSMTFELRAADNRSASLEAQQAIAGAARYVANVLTNIAQPGSLPDTNRYQLADVPVGDAAFWLIGRSATLDQPTLPRFGLVDEASKLNLNASWVTAEVLEQLPRMTTDLAEAIVTWRSSAGSNAMAGSGSDVYQRLDPPYRCKNAPFETVDELRLVYGATLDILYGEDVNLNGVLDLNENDGESTPPSDNLDGKLDSGILDYVTVYSHEPAATTNGTARVNVANLNSPAERQRLATLLSNAGISDANAVLARVTNGPPMRSVLQFYYRSGMAPEEFALIEDGLRNPNLDGLINVNTASAAVLTCVPGIGADHASSIAAYRQTRGSALTSLAWLKEILDANTAISAGPYLSGKTYQCTADIAAVGHHGRGYQRVKFIFDTSESVPKILYRQDLTHMGWALGKVTRDAMALAKAMR